jgi:small subunit ribosomal protein S4
MATRPKARTMRRFGEVMARGTKYQRILEKRPNPPGQHGGRRRRGREGAYGQRLMEKQKLRALYNISESQMRKYMHEANRRKGPTGTNLLQLLEQRLDMVIYRLGFAPSIWAARQVVGHGHVLVDGKRVDIPSFLVEPGQTIGLSEKMRRNQLVVESIGMGSAVPEYLNVNRDEANGKFERLPAREEIPVNINEALIVEFYAR